MKLVSTRIPPSSMLVSFTRSRTSHNTHCARSSVPRSVRSARWQGGGRSIKRAERVRSLVKVRCKRDSDGVGNDDDAEEEEEEEALTAGSSQDVESFRSQLIATYGAQASSEDVATQPAASADTVEKPRKKRRKPIYLPFEEGRKWARAMGMGSIEEWEDWAYNGRRNPYIPRDPEAAYPDKFVSWDDWLGIVHFMSFTEARDYVRGLKLKSMEEWFIACREKKLPKEIPVQPNYMYKNEGWVSYTDFLGIEEPEPPTRSSDECSS